MQCGLQGSDRYDPEPSGHPGVVRAIDASRKRLRFSRRLIPSHQRGQSLAEFALITPILLILLVGIADLGRVFATGIVVESATRNAAEIAAQQYLVDFPTWPPASPIPSGYYTDLHLKAARAVCAETRSLPNSSYTAGDCPTMPLVQVCVHDAMDDTCEDEPFGASIPPECNALAPTSPPATPAASPPNNTIYGTGTEQSRYVEVRVCYQFSMLTQVPYLWFGDLYIQRTRTFTVPDY
jgi:hypothetical protein